jgi:hypothetical protein
MDDEWRVPAPADDPEARKARLVRDGGGRARLVPEEDIVEGQIEEGGRDLPSCPFSSP